MLLVDTVAGRVIDDDELKETYANKQPYGEWLDRNLLKLEDLKIPNERVPEYTRKSARECRKLSVIHSSPCVKQSFRWQRTAARHLCHGY